MGWLVTVGGRVVEPGSFEFTLADPGGCETATLTLDDRRPAGPGDRIRIFHGIAELWDGEAEEPGHRQPAPGARAVTVAAVGAGVALKRNPFAMIYLDRDLNSWTGPPSAIEIAHSTAGFTPINGPSVSPDQSTGQPALKLAIDGAFDHSSGGLVEAYYDAGPLLQVKALDIAAITVNSVVAGLGSAWVSEVYSFDSTAGPYSARGALTTGFLFAPTLQRFIGIVVEYAVGSTTDAVDRWEMLTGVVVRGNHALPLYSDTNGDKAVRASDVARDAFTRSGADLDLVIADSTSALLAHLVSKTPQDPEKWISDAATFAGGWHYGVWPSTQPGGRRQGVFLPPASGRVYQVDFQDLQQPDLTERLSAMHNICRASYQFPDGSTGSISVRLEHPRIPAGIDQVLDVDAGTVASVTAAQAIATYRLELDQASARVAGSFELPYIRTPSGARVPAWLLRPGIDRLQIVGLPGTGSLLADPPARVDTFRVSRLTVTVGGGKETVRADVDAGADLTETLTARLTQAGELAGVS